MADPIKILIVDDSLIYRKILEETLRQLPMAEVVGLASNGKKALEALGQMSVDVILLDIEMPEMNGLETLQYIKQQYPDKGVIMISGMHKSSADITIKALESGAMDFISKPQNENAGENFTELRQKLSPLLNLFNIRRNVRRIETISSQPSSTVSEPVRPSAPTTLFKPLQRTRVDAIVMGVSTGGPNALSEVIPRLPADLGVPVLLVQHMPPVFTASLANSLDKKSLLRVKEAEDGEELQKNTVYIAPGGRHMEIQKGQRPFCPVVHLHDGPPENSCRPAVDVLFRSASPIYGKHILAVVMTGMGSDGAQGVKILKESGAYCLTQSAQTCVVYGMPKAVDDLGFSDERVPLQELADRMSVLVRANAGIR